MYVQNFTVVAPTVYKLLNGGQKGGKLPPIGQKVKLTVSRFKNVPKLYKIAKKRTFK